MPTAVPLGLESVSPGFRLHRHHFWDKSAAIACQSGARAAVAALLRQFSPAAWIRLDLIELRLKQIQSSNSNLRSKIRIFVRRLKFVRRKYPPQWVSGVCGAGVFCWARVSAAPRHSWLGCWGVCVLVCALCLSPVSPGGGMRCGNVCLGSGFGCAPSLLAGVLGCVRVCVRSPLVPRHSWLGCVVRVCVLGLGFWLRPATPGWGVVVCVCLCAPSACTQPLLAGVCGVGVCAWARDSAAPRHSWLGCWGVCVFVCALRLYHATHGSVVRCGCVCWGSSFGCSPPLLAGLLGCVCACVRGPLVPRHSWLGCAAWVFVLGLGFWLRPATPGWGVGVCVCLVRAPLVPRHSWLGCAVRLCVLRLGFRLRPATPGWGVGVFLCVFVCLLRLYPATPGWGVRCGCACLGSGFGCAAPLLAGASGCARACVRSPLVPRHCWLGCVVRVCVLGLGFRLRPATPGWAVGVCVPVCALRLYPATSG